MLGVKERRNEIGIILELVNSSGFRVIRIGKIGISMNYNVLGKAYNKE